MCWSATASITATTLGAVATAVAAKKNVPNARVFALGFFTLMELLQALSYIWINQCDITGNILLTQLGYIHIAFQIPVANALMLSFVSEKMQKKWFKPVMIISFIGTLIILIKLFAPLLWTIPKELMCKIGDPLCGIDTCTYTGSWHLAWRLPIMGFDSGFFAYFSLVFLLPLLYGSWRFSVFHFVFGPLLAWTLTTDKNESPAIWCLFSIAILCAIFVKPLKRWLETPMRKKKNN